MSEATESAAGAPDDFLVDGRGLEPPEPFVLAMEALDRLDRGQSAAVILLLYREPFPLYKVLGENGYRWTVRQEADGTFAIRIVRSVPADRGASQAGQTHPAATGGL